MPTAEKAKPATRKHLILAAIREAQGAGKPAPTIRELCQATGTSSTSTVHRWLDILSKQGFIAWEPGAMRTLRLVDATKPSTTLDQIALALGMEAPTTPKTHAALVQAVEALVARTP